MCRKWRGLLKPTVKIYLQHSWTKMENPPFMYFCDIKTKLNAVVRFGRKPSCLFWKKRPPPPPLYECVCALNTWRSMWSVSAVTSLHLQVVFVTVYMRAAFQTPRHSGWLLCSDGHGGGGVWDGEKGGSKGRQQRVSTRVETPQWDDVMFDMVVPWCVSLKAESLPINWKASC